MVDDHNRWWWIMMDDDDNDGECWFMLMQVYDGW